jgi:hypothetical protein
MYYYTSSIVGSTGESQISEPAEKSYDYCQGSSGYEELSRWFIRICVYAPIKFWVGGHG